MELLRENGRPGQRGEVAARGAGSQGAHHGLRPSRLQGRRRARGHSARRTPAGGGGGRPLQWEETAEIIERILAAEKNLFPNLDWPAGRLYHALGLEIPLYTPIFVMSRVAGWSAHFIEQQNTTG